MVILVNEEDDDEGFWWVMFLRVEVDESESESRLVSSLDPDPAEETLEATEDTMDRSTSNPSVRFVCVSMCFSPRTNVDEMYDLLFSGSVSSWGS